MLRENLKISRENRKILKRLQRSMRWGRFLRVVYWVVIIGGTLGAYYYIQPFVDNMKEMFSGIQAGTEGVTNGMGTGLDFLGNLFKK